MGKLPRVVKENIYGLLFAGYAAGGVALFFSLFSNLIYSRALPLKFIIQKEIVIIYILSFLLFLCLLRISPKGIIKREIFIFITHLVLFLLALWQVKLIKSDMRDSLSLSFIAWGIGFGGNLVVIDIARNARLWIKTALRSITLKDLKGNVEGAKLLFNLIKETLRQRVVLYAGILVPVFVALKELKQASLFVAGTLLAVYAIIGFAAALSIAYSMSLNKIVEKMLIKN